MKPILPAALALLLAATSAPAGPEPWADPKLPVTDGLELWLDARRVAGPGKPPAPAAKVETWHDGSGKARHVRQATADAKPTLLKAGGAGLVRFDGTDDHLRATGQKGEVRAFTLFVVLAPRSNGGDFRGFLGTNTAGGRDYQTGLTVGFGPAGTPRLADLNVEGRGFVGYRNLLRTPGPFGKLHTVEVRGGAEAVRAFVDGEASGERPREAGPLGLEEITVGARFPMAGNESPAARGHVRADFAEVLLYGRELPDAEAQQVRDYLTAKYAKLRDELPPDGDGRAEPLVAVTDPPPVQVFAPGFEARRLPVDLSNVNNVLYRPDGTLVALCYNGDVWHLTDTDGDGVEDKAVLFWEAKGRLRAPIGMDLTPPKYPRGDGVFVASKGKISLIVDTDGDGKADDEILVASGWKEINNNVDALAVAVDPKDGAVYYGRGATNFTDAYQRDKDGKAAYSLKVQEGVIVRVAPDFKTRETLVTGIRYPIALRFDRHGQLFATDQEGATWLPNGNPLDELLHIQKGRHYGFPPRHPKHLPDVIDEPSTFDYGPQHQSACGLNFNHWPTPFGPKAWAGDAFVTGYSRGKVYRTSLVKGDAGYVARTQLFASLPLLTIDACTSPDGAMVIACHGGGPDWGSGPTGKGGALFKVRYVDKDHPQPVLAWPAGPREVRVEFDRPVDPALLRDVLKGTKLTAGKYARAGDRFEVIWPGYAVVQMEKATPRYDVPVRSAQLTPDRRTLVLATDPLGAAVHYALTLPGMGRPAKGAGPKGLLPQYPAIDLDFDLSGGVATWTPKDGGPAWTGWLPHPDLQVARALTAGSAPHDALWKAMEKPGELVMKSQLNLTDMLRPAVQPGAKIDYEWPAEMVTIGFESSEAANLLTHADKAAPLDPASSHSIGMPPLKPERGKPVPVEFRLTVTSPEPSLSVWYTTNEDRRKRPLQLHRVLLPWADTKAAAGQAVAAAKPPELEGGSWARGRKVFHSEPANCSKCHAVHGQGGGIGPDLSNLVHRDYASVMRDITQPSFAINPDHVTQTVQLKDGRTLTGVVRTAGGKLTVGDVKGGLTAVDPADVEGVKSSAISTMPDDLVKQLGPDRTRDLLTFLLTPPPSMPRDTPGPRPKPRTVAEVNAVLAGSPSPPEKTRPVRVVLVAGPKDHGPGEHDYPAWQAAWKELLAAADGTEVATAWEWPAKDEWGKADVMVFFQRGDWNAQRAADVDAFLERGGGLVYIHWAVDGRQDAAGFAKRIGLAAHGGAVGFRHGPIELAMNAKLGHPVARNLDKLSLVDETYWNMKGDLPKDRVIAWADEEKAPRPQLWSVEHGKGRVFVSIPGHYSWTFDDPVWRAVLLRAIAWSAREPVDRFNDLVWPGADVAR